MARRIIQALFALVSNGYIKGFYEGNIYKGDIKKVCVPGLNCYSCPGAFGSCPIGSLQAVIGSMKYTFSFYVSGFLMLMGIVLGRFICGWLCPFGLFQDFLNKIPSKKVTVKGMWKNLKYLKYAVLAVFVILLPLVMRDELGISDPYFCKYICPAGTLEGGLSLVLMNESLKSTIGWLFAWKTMLLVVTIISSIAVFRPFCRFICPLGAIYSLFNRVSLYRFNVDKKACTSCGICESACKMGIKAYVEPNSPECIRCGDCVKSCPQGAIYREDIAALKTSREKSE